MVNPASKSLTLTANGGILRVLQTTCHLSVAHDPTTGTAPPLVFPFAGIWDTGASASAISQRVVDACGLAQIGMTQVQTADGLVDAETYLINIFLPNQVGFKHVQVTKANLGQHNDMLIGMDIISAGDFAITNKNGNTVFTFRVPSEVCFDFVKEHNLRTIPQNQKLSHGPGRRGKKKR